MASKLQTHIGRIRAKRCRVGHITEVLCMRKRTKKPKLSKEARAYMKIITKSTTSAKEYKRKFEDWMMSERR